MSRSTSTSDIAFTESVKRIQSARGSREQYARMAARSDWEKTVTPELRGFIESLDMFYLGTASADGRPYIQYRGGPKGFLKVLDERTLAFADFGGNRQYISVGNLAENPRAFIFLMDYANAARVKVWGEARVVEDEPELLAQLSDPSYDATVERAIVFTIEAWNGNCPQHIHPRFDGREVEELVTKLKERIGELEAEVTRLRGGETRAS